MATNEILRFAETDTGTNLLTQAEYLADSQRPIGNQPGVARSKLVNKALRQASLIAAGLAEYIADNQANNITDALTPRNIADYLQAAITGALGVTPPQFDDDTSLATTAFVQRALGNLQAIVASNGTLALDQTYCGDLLVGNAAGTITLPSGGATASGATIIVQAIVNGVVVSRNGADNIYFANGATQTAVALNRGDWAIFSWFPGYGWVAYGVVAPPSVVGTARNVKMSVTAASSTATLTADEMVVSTGLGGLSYKIGSFNKSVNLATTGAGGMDTGAAPASGYVALYAIYNPNTGASALLAVNASSAVAPNVYGGANMPAGYAASALVSVWPTTAGSQFTIGLQRDRKISRPLVALFNATNAAFTSVSIAGAAPPNAVGVGGLFHCITNTAGGGMLDLAADANGSGLQSTGVGGTTNTGVWGAFENLPVLTQQTIYYRTLNMGTADASLSSYII